MSFNRGQIHNGVHGDCQMKTNDKLRHALQGFLDSQDKVASTKAAVAHSRQEADRCRRDAIQTFKACGVTEVIFADRRWRLSEGELVHVDFTGVVLAGGPIKSPRPQYVATKGTDLLMDVAEP